MNFPILSQMYAKLLQYEGFYILHYYVFFNLTTFNTRVNGMCFLHLYAITWVEMDLPSADQQERINLKDLSFDDQEVNKWK